MTIEGSYPDKTVANCSINAVEIYWRFMGVSKYENAIRLYQNIASGSQLDFCIVGTFNNYPETKDFDAVREIFAYHERNEEYYGQMESKADIVLIRRHDTFHGLRFDERPEEYDGIFKSLKEGHYNFDVVMEEWISNDNIRRDYKLAVLPGVSVDPSVFGPDTSILATSGAYRDQPELLDSLFDANYIRTESENKGSYVVVKNKRIFDSFKECNWVFVYNDVHLMDYTNGYLEYMPRTKYAPVESANDFKTSGYYLTGIKKDGEKTNLIVPFGLGLHYYRYGYTEHRDILFDLLDNIMGLKPIETNAPEMAELFYSGCPGGRMVQFVNLTGYNGRTYFAPVPINDIEVTVPFEGAKSVRNLISGEDVEFTTDKDEMTIKLATLGDYVALYISQ